MPRCCAVSRRRAFRRGSSSAIPSGSGPERVRVQIALGDLADPQSFRNALRGVKTVVHLAAASRDQPQGSIEELGGIATWRMVAAAEKAGVEHFVFFSALSASAHNRTRFLRSKALAEKAVVRERPSSHDLRAVDRLRAGGPRARRCSPGWRCCPWCR